MKRRRAAKTSALGALRAASDGRRLSEGALAQASVRGRLLGIPLLRLDASVLLIPATIVPSSSALTAGNGLADAVRSINEGAEILAEVRRGAEVPRGDGRP